MNKCLNHFGRLSHFFLIAITMLVLSLGGQSYAQDTVSTTWCLNQVEKIAKQNESCRSELSKTRIELEKSKAKRNGLVEELGIFALGVGVAYTNFNPLALIVAGYLIIFQ